MRKYTKCKEFGQVIILKDHLIFIVIKFSYFLIYTCHIKIIVVIFIIKITVILKAFKYAR